MVVRRVTAAAAAVATVGVATKLGWSDVGRSLDLLTGRTVSTTTALALVATLCWTALAVVGALIAAGPLAVAVRGAGATPWRRAVLTALVGALLLGAGLAHHQQGYHVCCTSAQTTRQAESLVH